MKRVSAEHRRPMEWLRLYAEFADDPKVQMLSEAMQRRYVMLLCLTRKELIPTRDDSAVAFALRLSAKETQRTKRVLKAAKLIGDDWKPSAWDRRQFASDHSGAERQKRYRDKHRDSNVTVTAASRHGDGLEGEGEEKNNQRREDSDAEGECDSSSQAGASQLAQSGGDRKTVMRDCLRKLSPR